MTFAEKLRAWNEPLVLYEVIPPDQSAPREEIADQAAYITNLLTDHDIDAINIPEIRNEERNGNRKAGFMEKYDPRQFGKIIQDISTHDTEIITNHVIAHAPPKEQQAWFHTTYTTFDIPNLILVGGETSTINYPGPTVPQAAQLAQQTANDTNTNACLGGITIPTRRRDTLDEPQRMIQKQNHGIEYFTSQVIYEAQSTQQLLTDYHHACQQTNTQPAPIFLSFAPITGKKDARFLEWLGVNIPKPAKQWIHAPHARPLERSTRIAEHTLRDILTHAHDHNLNIPLGINVEHIMRYNFEASEILLQNLQSLLELHHLQHPNTPTREPP